jgi:phosphatidylserine/phosphatidylglycerophosphate/cardiolipin synthase-like enzyme
VLAVNTEELKRRCGKKDDLLQIFEWHGEKYNESTIHSKFAIFDDQEALVGSFNLDARSTFINSETAVVIRSRSYVAQVLEQLLSRDMPKFERVTAEQAQGWFDPKDRKKKVEIMLRSALRPGL